MRNNTLKDLNEIAKESGNDNPTIWIKSDLEDDVGKSVSPENIFIDEDGDIIIDVALEGLMNL